MKKTQVNKESVDQILKLKLKALWQMQQKMKKKLVWKNEPRSKETQNEIHKLMDIKFKENVS